MCRRCRSGCRACSSSFRPFGRAAKLLEPLAQPLGARLSGLARALDLVGLPAEAALLAGSGNEVLGAVDELLADEVFVLVAQVSLRLPCAVPSAVAVEAAIGSPERREESFDLDGRRRRRRGRGDGHQRREGDETGCEYQRHSSEMWQWTVLDAGPGAGFHGAGRGPTTLAMTPFQSAKSSMKPGSPISAAAVWTITSLRPG